MRNRTTLVGIIAIALATLILAMPSHLLLRFGRGDFVAYWSASYLLARGGNFADPAQIQKVENEYTDWKGDFPIMTWNPPWLLVFLMPYTCVPFDRAAWWWLLTNVGLAFVSVVLLWRLTASLDSIKRKTWIAVLITFTYSSTATALIAGQVNFLVLIGLVAFLYLISKRQAGFAGAVLALTTIKPQLVYVTLPVLLLDLVRRRCWRALAGFLIALGGLTALVFLLHPTFIFDYIAATSGGNLFRWETPTLGGALETLLGWSGSKFMGALVLPLTILLWWCNGGQWDTRTMIDVTLLISVITTPFGWSYDFVVLLVPLLRVVVWLIEGGLHRVESIVLALILLCANVVMYIERVLTPSEVYFFWVPLVIAGVYTYGLFRRREG